MLEALKIVPGVKSAQYVRTVNDNVNEYVVDPIMGYDIRRDLFKLMSVGKWPILELKSNELTLEDIFLRLTDESTNVTALERALSSASKKEETETQTDVDAEIETEEGDKNESDN